MFLNGTCIYMLCGMLNMALNMMVSFVLSFFPRDVLDEILNLIGSVSEGFPSYFYCYCDISSFFVYVCSLCVFLSFLLLVSLCETSKSYRIQLRDVHTRNSNIESSEMLGGVVFFDSHIWIFLCGLNVFYSKRAVPSA